jgi:hypothetical protein
MEFILVTFLSNSFKKRWKPEPRTTSNIPILCVQFKFLRTTKQNPTTFPDPLKTVDVSMRWLLVGTPVVAHMMLRKPQHLVQGRNITE